MAIRTITFTADANGYVTPSTPQDAGVAGEINATNIVFNLPPALINANYKYRFECTDGLDRFDTKEDFTLTAGQSSVNLDIPYDWTAAGGIATVRLVISQLGADNTTLMEILSLSAKLKFANRSTGTGMTEEQIRSGLTELIEKLLAQPVTINGMRTLNLLAGRYIKMNQVGSDLTIAVADELGDGSASAFDNWPKLPYKRMGWVFPDFNVDCLAALPDGKYDMVSCVWYQLQDDGSYYYRINPDVDGRMGLGTEENINFVKKYTKEQYINVACGGPTCTTKMANFFLHYQTQFIQDLRMYVVNNNFTGIDVDFERYASWTPALYLDFKKFITALCTEFHSYGKKVIVDAPAIWNDVWDGNSPYEWMRRYQIDPATGKETTIPIASADYFPLKYDDFNTTMPVDGVVVMCYDYMWDIGSGAPNCPTQWLIDTCQYALSKLPAEKIIIGLPADGYIGPDTTTAHVTDGIEHHPYYIIEGQIGFAGATRNPDSLELEWRDGTNYYNVSDTYTIDQKNKIVSDMGITNLTYWHLGGNKIGTLGIISDMYPKATEIKRMGWMFPDYSIDASIDYYTGKFDTISCMWYDMDKTQDGVVYLRTGTGEDGDGKYGMPFDANIDYIKKSSHNQYVDVSCAIPAVMDKLCSDPSKISNFIETTLDFITKNEFEGIDFDFETFGYSIVQGAEVGCTSAMYGRFTYFIQQVVAAYHTVGKKVMVTAPPIWGNSCDLNSPYEWRQRNPQAYYQFKYEDFNTLCNVDYLVPMAYDYYLDVYQSGLPCSPLQWMLDIANWAKSKVPVEKIIMGIPAAGYFYQSNIFHPLTYKQASACGTFNTAVRDAASGEMYFTYSGGYYRYMDDETIDIKTQALATVGITAYSLWHIGNNKYGTPPNDTDDTTPVVFNDNSYSDKLKTVDKTIVGSINEVQAYATFIKDDIIGNDAPLETDAKIVIDAINEVLSKLNALSLVVGNANNLSTVNKTVIPAINEVFTTCSADLLARVPNPLIVLTQAEYDALVTAGTVHENTVYLIKEG